MRRARAADVADLTPDLLVLQECGRPAAETARVRWFGANSRHGLALVAGHGYALEAVTPAPALADSVFPAWLDCPGGSRLLVLGVWAKRRPTYVGAIRAGIEAYAPLLRETPAVIAGDFNSHVRFDRPGTPGHAELETWLRGEFGLVSAYHAWNGAEAEPPTHFWRWQATRGFHIDYCFVPEAWRDGLRGARVLDEPPGSRRSDHRPLVVDVEPSASREATA